MRDIRTNSTSDEQKLAWDKFKDLRNKINKLELSCAKLRKAKATY